MRTPFLFFTFFFTAIATFSHFQAAAQVVDNSSLDNHVICGYQGWFAYPGDGAAINRWRHWFSSIDTPTVPNLTVDMYPLVDEYDPADLADSEIPMNGGFAKFYSTTRPNVVDKHFEWMKIYGISGVFHMRFMKDIQNPNNFSWKTGVLRNVRAAAENHGRVFATSYNMAGTGNEVIEQIREDWMYLVDNEGITSSNRYLHHHGRPVLRIYGIGFDSVNVTDTVALAELIDWFQNSAEERYRVFLIGGLPSQWRTLTGDSRPEPEWLDIYGSLDGIHPWHVGRWASTNGFDSFYANRITQDSFYCASRGIHYMPTMWPGFSWHNLQGDGHDINAIPRDGGNFMWAQAYRFAENENIKTVWMAQFDEVDEGTAIYKVAKNDSELPDEGA